MGAGSHVAASDLGSIVDGEAPERAASEAAPPLAEVRRPPRPPTPLPFLQKGCPKQGFHVGANSLPVSARVLQGYLFCGRARSACT